MAYILRFRPVTLGDVTRPTVVAYLGEGPDGRAYFRDTESSWPLEVSLREVTVQDLPEFYQGRGFPIIILPVREVAGETEHESSRRITKAIEEIYERGASPAELAGARG
jgi:hypothetical protein